MRIEFPETPEGKRSVKENIYGNIVGYVAGKRFWEFGSIDNCSRAIAKAWKEGESLEEAQFAILKEGN